MMKKLSATAKEIILNREGFRNENFGVRKVFNLEEIIKFETEVLGNTDINFTCNKLYSSTWGEVVHSRFDGSIENVYGLWLTNKDGLENYVYDQYECDQEVNKYRLPSDFLIISDLGDQGILIGTRILPEDLIIESIQRNKKIAA